MVYLGESGYYGIGGIVGSSVPYSNISIIEECYNIGEVYSLSNYPTGNQAGGIIGNASKNNSDFEIEIKNCYNVGFIHGIGLLGGIVAWGRDITVLNCYNVGKLEIEESYTGWTGGIIACVAEESTNVINNNYWLSDCGGMYGWRKSNSSTGYNDGAESKNEEEMKSLTNIIGDAYKEDSENMNFGYPILNWQ